MPTDLLRPGEVAFRGAVTDQLGQAEVGDLHDPVPAEQNVFRLDVAVDDARLVGVRQGVADLARCWPGSSTVTGRWRSRPQRPGRPQLHDEVERTCGLAEVVDGDDVRMIQPGHGTGLAGESLRKTRGGGDVGPDQLQRHVAVELDLMGPADDPHSTAPQLPEDHAVADRVARPAEADGPDRIDVWEFHRGEAGAGIIDRRLVARRTPFRAVGYGQDLRGRI